MNKKSTRMAFGEALVELSDKYDFVVLDADLSKATCTNLFASKYSNRFFNMGISEADMMGNAAGMASCGAKVIAATFAIFATGRAYEQVRTSIAYADMDVKIIGTHAGVLIGEDGATHQCIEDIALMRAIPGMIILIAADANQVKPILEAAIKYIGPVYIRLGRLDVDYVYKKTPEALIGGADKLMDGTDVTIIATGEMVYESLEAAKILNAKNIKAEVINAYSIKPLNEDIIITSAKKTNLVFTVEDHNIYGGLGSAVSQLLADKYKTTVKTIGINDTFGRSGKRDELKKFFELNAESIVNKILKMVL